MNKFEVGDRVWSPLFGWGTVTDNIYTVNVKFDTGDAVLFTSDGKYHTRSVNTKQQKEEQRERQRELEQLKKLKEKYEL